MDILEVQQVAQKISTVNIHADSDKIFMIYKSKEESFEAYDALKQIFGDEEISIRLEFIRRDYNIIDVDAEKDIQDTPGTVSMTIFNASDDFIRMPNIDIANNNEEYFRALSIAMRHKVHHDMDKEYQFVKLIIGHLSEKRIYFRTYVDTGEPCGFTNIRDIIIIPEPRQVIKIPGSGITVGPDDFTL
jgi:hypothetical protein